MGKRKKIEKVDIKTIIILLLVVGIGISSMQMPFIKNASVERFDMGIEEKTPLRTRGIRGMYGGTLRVALKEDVNLNPLTADDEFSWNVINLVYDSLARMDPETLLPKPWVAKSWVVNTTDNKTITLELRTDVTWHDGTLLTADDVAYTYSAEGMKSSARYASILTGVNVTKIDEDTVEFILNKSNAAFFDRILRVPLIPEGFDGSSENGCGPFVLSDHIVGEKVIIDAYEDYFNGRPYLDAIQYTFYSNTTEASKALIKREIDFIGWSVNSTDTTDIIFVGYNTTLLNETHISVVKNPGLSFLSVVYNTANYPLNDPNLRKAIAYCLDKDTHSDLEPGTTVIDSIVNLANAFWYNTSVPKYRVEKTVDSAGRETSDLTRPTEILDSSGYIDVDSDGWRDSPNGTSFDLTLLVPSNEIDPRKAAIGVNIWDMMTRVGINTKVEQLMIDEIEENITNDNFDLCLLVQDTTIDPSFMYDLFHSSQIVTNKNIANYNNTTFDNLIEKANSEMDITSRQQYIKDCQGWLAEQLPCAPLLSYKVIEVCDKTNFTGWVSMLGGINNFWSFINLHYKMEGDMEVTVYAYPDSVTSGDEVDVSVDVKDILGTGLGGVKVNLTADGKEIGVVITESDGTFNKPWTAPNVTAVTTLTITANASCPHYWDAQATTQITIHPLIHIFDWDLTAQPNVINSSEKSTIYVIVRDETGSPVKDVNVTLTVTPENAGCNVTQASGRTDATGTFITIFTGNTSVEAFFKITAIVNKLGYGQDSKSATIAVHKPPTLPNQWLPFEGSILLIGTAVIAVGAVVIVFLLAVFYGTIGRKKKRRGEK